MVQNTQAATRSGAEGANKSGRQGPRPGDADAQGGYAIAGFPCWGEKARAAEKGRGAMTSKTAPKKGTDRPKPNNGNGRPKGATNKVTRELKEMILGALDDAGGQAYLLAQAKANPQAFLTLIGKVLPTTINANVDANVKGSVAYVANIPKRNG